MFPPLLDYGTGPCIALMTFSFVRIEAALQMNIEDYYQLGKKWKINLHEKDGKEHDMPVHHNKLEEYLDAHIVTERLKTSH